MQIKLFKDLKKYALTSTLTKKDIELVKKYRPSSLKVQDADGNDIFAISYCEGRPCISANGVTFGAASNDGGFAMITGDLPSDLSAGTTYGDWVADKVGAALPFINAFERDIPGIVCNIRNERADLLEGIVEA